MNALEASLVDEYYRMRKAYTINQLELERAYIKGSISIKRIHVKEFTYLQWRECEHVKSKYLDMQAAARIAARLQKQKEWKRQNRQYEKQMRQIVRAIGQDIINDYREQYEQELSAILKLYEQSRMFG